MLQVYIEQILSIDINKKDLQLAIKKAKAKILDLAIHGKLVSQDKNDKLASVFVEKLRAEKEEKIAKGELKRDKNDSFIYKGSDNCYYKNIIAHFSFFSIIYKYCLFKQKKHPTRGARIIRDDH